MSIPLTKLEAVQYNGESEQRETRAGVKPAPYRKFLCLRVGRYANVEVRKHDLGTLFFNREADLTGG